MLDLDQLFDFSFLLFIPKKLLNSGEEMSDILKCSVFGDEDSTAEGLLGLHPCLSVFPYKEINQV